MTNKQRPKNGPNSVQNVKETVIVCVRRENADAG